MNNEEKKEKKEFEFFQTNIFNFIVCFVLLFLVVLLIISLVNIGKLNNDIKNNNTKILESDTKIELINTDLAELKNTVDQKITNLENEISLLISNNQDTKVDISKTDNKTIIQQKNEHDVFIDGQLTSGYDMGVDSSYGYTDWVVNKGNYMHMSYPEGERWGAVFITKGTPTDPPRPYKDLSKYKKLQFEMRGLNGNENIKVGIKDNSDPDNGKEAKILIENIETKWKKFEYDLSEFWSADLKKLYVVTEFVFEGSTGYTVDFKNIKFIE